MPDWRSDIRNSISSGTRAGREALSKAVSLIAQGSKSAARQAISKARDLGATHVERTLMLLALGSGKAATVTAVAAFLIGEGWRDLSRVLADVASHAGDVNAAKALVTGLIAVPGVTVATLCLAAATLHRASVPRAVAVQLRALARQQPGDLLAALAQQEAIGAVLAFFFDHDLERWSDVPFWLETAGSLPNAVTADAVFSALLAAFVAISRARTAAAQLGERIAAWLLTPGGPTVRIADPILQHTGLNRVVPRRYTLLAAGLAQWTATPVAQGNVLPVLHELVRALVAAGQDVAAQVIVAMGQVPGLLIALLPGLVRWAAGQKMRFLDWLGRDLRDVGLQLHELPAPRPADQATGRKAVKYMIFSDIHRDDPKDVVDPLLFDVSHFRRNRKLYLRALRYCKEEGYSVIENGDCEELWYQAADDNVAGRASRILADHADVFSVLAELHADGRYFRARGNHDNWWVMASGRLGPLDAAMRPDPSAPPFKLWDALVIPDVRCMDTELLSTNLPTNETELLRVLDDILPLGLSPLRYTKRLPMLVLHGHQIDFWNCDEHYLLGLALTNAFGVPADGVDALPYYLKGVDYSGNPVVDFGEMMTAIYPWDNWLPDGVSRKRARRIEIMKETDRHLSDSISFSETLAASLSLLVSYGSSATICSAPGPRLQIAMGHTHNPQSRPYLRIPTGTPAKPLADRALGWVKLPYYNSGTSGWWENIVWALEITDFGQPRLVYWDQNAMAPHVMTWELHNLEPPSASTVQGLRTRWDALITATGVGAPGGTGALLSGAVSPADAWSAAWGRLLDLGPADELRQQAGAAAAQLAALKDAVCGASLPSAPLTLTVDFSRIVEFAAHTEATPGPRRRPTLPLADAARGILDGIGVTITSQSALVEAGVEMVRDLASVLLCLAMTYRAPMLHGTALALLMACDRDRRIRIGRNGATLRLELKLGGV